MRFNISIHHEILGFSKIVMNHEIVRLCDLESGEKGLIVNIKGGWGLIRRIAEMGFTPGTEVTVVRELLLEDQ